MFGIYILYFSILAAIADNALVWKQKAGPYLQAMQFALCVGAIISPLVAGPFLAKTITLPTNFGPLVSNVSTLVPQYL
jgi:hypothetical protein